MVHYAQLWEYSGCPTFWHYDVMLSLTFTSTFRQSRPTGCRLNTSIRCTTVHIINNASYSMSFSKLHLFYVLMCICMAMCVPWSMCGDQRAVSWSLFSLFNHIDFQDGTRSSGVFNHWATLLALNLQSLTHGHLWNLNPIKMCAYLPPQLSFTATVGLPSCPLTTSKQPPICFLPWSLCMFAFPGVLHK